MLVHPDLQHSRDVPNDVDDEEADDAVDDGEGARDEEGGANREVELAHVVDHVLYGNGRQRVEPAADGGEGRAKDPSDKEAGQARDVAH